MQAAYTDPINPVFNAVSPQPLYSFAAGYTHIFSPHLVNYFNPAFSWYESLFGPQNLQQTLAAFPIVLQGIGANAPFTPLGGLGQHLGAGAARDPILHQRQPGVEPWGSRISLRNEYADLPVERLRFRRGDGADGCIHGPAEFIYGVASTATATYPLADSQPFRFLNLDFYAQDTWRVTSKLTWTFGLRDTYNSNPLNPHDAVARLPGSFDSISHDVNQPLSDLIETHLGNLFQSTPLAILQPRTASRGRSRRETVLRSGFGLFSDLLPGSVADLAGANPPYVNTFQGGLLGTAGGTAIAPGVPNSAIDATAAANQNFLNGFAQGELSCAASGTRAAQRSLSRPDCRRFPALMGAAPALCRSCQTRAPAFRRCR